MARAAAQMKMGYYPTPKKTLELLKEKVDLDPGATIIDPCCGEGTALKYMTMLPREKRTYYYVERYAPRFGVEVDVNRASTARDDDDCRVVSGSIYDTVIRPAGCFSMLYLNPPYEYEKGERMEFLFLKKSHGWLRPEGLLIYLVPEFVLKAKKIAMWINRRYKNIRIYRFHRDEYPVFKQVALFAVKLPEEKQGQVAEELGNEYPYIEDMIGDYVYPVIPGEEPTVFELKGMTPEEVIAQRKNTVFNIKKALGIEKKEAGGALSPLFPLRKGHIVSLLMSGVLNGRLAGNVVFKCFTKRTTSSTEISEDGKTKHITIDSYASGIRVIEKGQWYDVI